MSIINLIKSVLGFATGGIGSFLINYAISYVINKAFAPDKPEAPKDLGVVARVQSDTGNKLPIVYGTKKIAGSVIMQDISSDNQTMAFIIALAEGPVAGVNKVYWQDKRLKFEGSITSGLKNVYEAKTPDQENTTDFDDFLNDGRMKCKFYPSGGRCKEMEEFSSKWKDYTGSYDGANPTQTNRQMPNIVYAYIELTYDRDKSVTGLPSQLFFSISGRTVKQLTSPTTLASSSSASSNPSDCLIDYLTNTTYGCSIPVGDLDLASFHSHRTFCNELKAYVDTSGASTTGFRYTTHGVLNTNQTADVNISDLTVGNSASFNWTLGKFGLITDKVKASTFSLSEDDIYGGISISGVGFDSKLNSLTLRYYDKQAKELEGQVILEVPESNKNDNEPLLKRTLTFPFTNNNIEANRAGAVILNQSRQSLVISLTTDLSALQTQAGDIISVTHTTPAWTNKKFKILSVDEVVTQGNITLEITAQEYADAVYDDLMLNEYDVASNSGLPNPYRLPVINSLTATEDTGVLSSNLTLSWLDGGASLTSEYLISYKITGAADSTAEHKTLSSGLKYSISPLLPSTNYTITVRPVSVFGIRGNSITVTQTTTASRLTGTTSRGAWPTTGTVSINNGDIWSYSGDLWFYTGTSTSLDASSTNPSIDDIANDRWDQVDIPSGADGKSIIPIYSTSSAGANQVLTQGSSHPFVNFYETASVITASDLPISGLVFAAYLPNVELRIYMNSVGRPTTPTASTTIPSGWTTAVPAPNNQILWSSAGIKTHGIGNYVWGSAARETGYSGVDGSNSAIVRVYKKASSEPISTDKPNGDLTYTFNTGLLSGSNFNNWGETVPVLAAGETSYIRRAVAYNNGSTVTIPTDGWSGPSIFNQVPLNAIRNASGFVYFSLPQAGTPANPTATAYNYGTGALTALPANWSTASTTLDASQSNSYWQASFYVTEATYQGTQTVTFGAPQKVATFSNVLASNGLAAGQSLKVGDLLTSSTAITNGSGALFKADGDAFIGSVANSIVVDSSAGTIAFKGKFITGDNVSHDGTTIITNEDGVMGVGSIQSTQVVTEFVDLGNIDHRGNNSDVSSSYTKEVRIGSLDNRGAAGSSNQTSQETAASTADYTISTTENIIINGDLEANGGSGGGAYNYIYTGHFGDHGGSGGNIFLTSTTGDVYLKNVLAYGGKGGLGSSHSANTSEGDADHGGDGGDAGNITIVSTLGNIYIEVVGGGSVVVDANGGDSGNAFAQVDTGGDGGAGGTITLSALNGCIFVTGSEEASDGVVTNTSGYANGNGLAGTAGSISKNNSAGNTCN